MIHRPSTVAKRAALRAKRAADELAAIETAKAELAAQHGLIRDYRFDKAWALAWDHGHASGIWKVKNYFADLVDLIKT